MTAMARLTPLLFLLWVGVTVNTVVDLQKRIIGGQTCEPTERLYHVMLIANDGTRNFLCGGSLISDRWILTAAHCWKGTMTAHLSVHPGNNRQDGVAITRHETVTDELRDHDIMLLELPNPTRITPVPLPDIPSCQNQPTVPLGATVQIAGYGPKPGERPSDTLQCAYTEVVRCTDQNDQFRFCGQRNGVALCSGDSGGGVVYNDRIYGIIRGLDRTNICTEKSAFVNVCSYRKWIKKITDL